MTKKKLRAIRVTGAPPKAGKCPVRPPIDGSQGNPMVFCSFRRGHQGRHSWQPKETR
jgi:hypothetical protein